MMGALLQSGTLSAKEWETETVRELLVSPAPGTAVIAGKVLAGLVGSFALGTFVLLLTTLLGWRQPEGIYWLTSLGMITLISLFGPGLGAVLGALLKQSSPTIAISINLAIYLFFLSGGIGVLAFEPVWLQDIAAIVALTYGMHALELALFYSSTDLLARDALVMAALALLALLAGAWAIRRGQAE